MEIIQGRELNGKVINYSEIPDELKENHWLNESYPGFVMVHLDGGIDNTKDPLDIWILENYPELENEDYFFIEKNS